MPTQAAQTGFTVVIFAIMIIAMLFILKLAASMFRVRQQEKLLTEIRDELKHLNTKNNQQQLSQESND